MKNGWTGGQYSLLRALVGAGLLVYFAAWLPRTAELVAQRAPTGASSPLSALPDVFALAAGTPFVHVLLAAAILLAALFALGLRDRAAAAALSVLCASLAVRRAGAGDAHASFGLMQAAVVLAAHTLLARAPYGALDARGRIDPRGGWTFHPKVFAALWILLAAEYAFGGFAKLVQPAWRNGTAVVDLLAGVHERLPQAGVLLMAPPVLLAALTWGMLALELVFAPLALFRRARPWIWGAAAVLPLASLLVLGEVELPLGMLLLHLYTLDPAWVEPRRASEPERVFYDGTCGLCHGFVRFVLAEDTRAAFRFAPLQGETFAALVPERERAALPDSMVARTSDGRLLLRSAVVAHVLSRLGGAWRLLAELLEFLPRPLRDAGYDALARVRHRLFAKPEGACPLVPRDLGRRFEI